MFANDFQTHMNTLSVLSVGAKVKGLLSTDGLMLHADIMGDEDMVGTLAEGDINVIPLDDDILGFFVMPMMSAMF